MNIDSNLTEQQVLQNYLFSSISVIAALEFIRVIKKNFLKQRREYQCPFQNFIMIIKKYMDINVKKRLVYLLSKCKCCERHPENRPLRYEPWIETTFNYTPNNGCKCLCRHYSRFICRTCE